MTDRLITDTSKTLSPADQAALESLQKEIKFHEKRDDNRSVLAKGVGTVWETFSRDVRSVDSLKSFYKEAERKLASGDAATVAETRKEIAKTIQSDRQALGLRDTVAHYGTGFAKTAGLFMRGPLGVASTIGLHGLDQWKTNESLQNQIADFGLGAAKGGGMKMLFHVLGDKGNFAASKGIALGMGNTALDMLLTRNTYKDGLNQGLSNVGLQMIDLKARAVDGAIFVVSEGGFRGLNRFTGGAIKESPLLSTMFTGGSFGMSSGAAGEYMRQKSAGESLDLTKIVEKAALQGLVDTAAASFGGIQALRAANRPDSTCRQYVTTAGQEQLAQLRTNSNVESMLRVQEILGKRWNGALRLGAEQNLLIAHNSETTPVNAEKAGAADAVACCKPDTLPDGIKAKHVLPDASGKVRVDILDNGRIRVVAADSKLSPLPDGKSIDLMHGHDGHGHGSEGPTPTTGSEISNLLARRRQGAAAEERPDATAQGPKRPVLEVHPTLVPVAQELVRLSMNLCAPEGGAVQKQAVVEFIKAHPELITFSTQLAEIRGNAKFNEAIAEAVQRPDGMPLKVYRTEQGLKNTFELWEETRKGYFHFFLMGEPTIQAKATTAVRIMIESYPELSSAADAYARACPDLNIVRALDGILGTKHAESHAARLEAEARLAAVERAMASSAGDAAAAAGKIDPALVRPEPVSATGKPGDAGKTALSTDAAKTTPLEAAQVERVRALSVADVKERIKAAEDLVDHLDKLSYQDFDRWLQAVDSPDAVALLARGLDCQSRARIGKTVGALGDHLINLPDPLFERWRDAAVEHLLDGLILDSPAIRSLPVSVQKQFLSQVLSLEGIRTEQWRQRTGSTARFAPAEEVAPEWARDHVERSKLEQERQKARLKDKWHEPWRPRFNDYLDARMDLLKRTAEALEKCPLNVPENLKYKLLELGASDKEGLLWVLDAVGNREVERGSRNFQWIEGDARIDANRKLLAELLPHANSMEPLKYLFRFLRERNGDGAFAAAQEMKPPVPSRTLPDIRNDIVAAKTAAGEPIDQAQVDAEARGKLAEITRQDQNRWNEIRRLISDIANGRIRSPERGKPGAAPTGDAGKRGHDSIDPDEHEFIEYTKRLRQGSGLNPVADGDFDYKALPDGQLNPLSGSSTETRDFAEYFKDRVFFDGSAPAYKSKLSIARFEPLSSAPDGPKLVRFGSDANAVDYATYLTGFFKRIFAERATVAYATQFDSLGGDTVPRFRIRFKDTNFWIEGAVVLDAQSRVTGLLVGTDGGERVMLPARCPESALLRNNGRDLTLRYKDGKQLTILADNIFWALSPEAVKQVREQLDKAAAPAPPPAPPPLPPLDLSTEKKQLDLVQTRTKMPRSMDVNNLGGEVKMFGPDPIHPDIAKRTVLVGVDGKGFFRTRTEYNDGRIEFTFPAGDQLNKIIKSPDGTSQIELADGRTFTVQEPPTNVPPPQPRDQISQLKNSNRFKGVTFVDLPEKNAKRALNWFISLSEAEQIEHVKTNKEVKVHQLNAKTNELLLYAMEKMPDRIPQFLRDRLQAIK